MQANTNNINKKLALLQTTGSKDEPKLYEKFEDTKGEITSQK